MWTFDSLHRLHTHHSTWPSVLHDLVRDAVTDLAKPTYGKQCLEDVKRSLGWKKWCGMTWCSELYTANLVHFKLCDRTVRIYRYLFCLPVFAERAVLSGEGIVSMAANLVHYDTGKELCCHVKVQLFFIDVCRDGFLIWEWDTVAVWVQERLEVCVCKEGNLMWEWDGWGITVSMSDWKCECL